MPAPQIHSLGADGDKKAESWTSPMPFVRSPTGTGAEITGTMVRVMRFQSGFTLNGTTGWKLTTCWVSLSGPTFGLMFH